jgi:hypothetical protein
MLPTTSRDQKRLIALPCSHAGRFTYLNTFTRQLVVSEKPLLPPSPPPVRKDKSGKLRAALRGYRPPLRCVPEDIEDAAMLAAIIKEKS